MEFEELGSGRVLLKMLRRIENETGPLLIEEALEKLADIKDEAAPLNEGAERGV